VCDELRDLAKDTYGPRDQMIARMGSFCWPYKALVNTANDEFLDNLEKHCAKLSDYGGGLGELGLKISVCCKTTDVGLYNLNPVVDP
jgi:hypothetical protein